MHATMHGVCVHGGERERVYSWKVSNKVHTNVNTCKVFPLIDFMNAYLQQQIYVPLNNLY
jgi:hypothetical protein